MPRTSTTKSLEESNVLAVLSRAEEVLCNELARIPEGDFGALVKYVYNPLIYAAPAVQAYRSRFGRTRKKYVLLGMNPGPFGMGQTGVPFGEVSAVRNYLGIEETIQKPVREHPKRPVVGFACKRSEVSGARLWAGIAARHPLAEDFFARAFVLNYCPLLFLGDSGANITPDKLPKTTRKRIEDACDLHLVACIDALAPSWLIGIGGYAKACAERVVAQSADPGIKIAQVPHPSPASPLANKGWHGLAQQALRDAGIDDLL
jgi:single-strand selective monofunctional uracil DNA glycosylase